MPAFTPNRGYPYPLPTDPADVPQALQDLAEAVDDDVEARDVVIRSRPFVKVRGSNTTPVPVSGGQVYLPFEIEDFDTDDMADLSVNRTSITIQTAGFYWAHARVRIYLTGTPPTNPFVIMSINVNDTPITVGRYHTVPTGPDYFDASISAAFPVSVGDVLQLAFNHNYPNNENLSRFRELSAFRVAN